MAGYLTQITKTQRKAAPGYVFMDWGAGAACSINKLVELPFPEVCRGPQQMNIHQPGSGKAEFPLLLQKGA